MRNLEIFFLSQKTYPKMCGFSETYIQKDMLFLTSAHAAKCSIIFSSRNKLIISLQQFPRYFYFSISTSKILTSFKGLWQRPHVVLIRNESCAR